MSRLPSAGSKDTVLMAISSGPSFNYTSHKKDAVAGYTLYSFIDNAEATAEHTFFNGQPAYLLDQTTQPKCFGDAAGIGGGVKSGTIGGEVKPTSGSSTIFIEGKALIREGDTCTMNNGNVKGMYVTVDAAYAAQIMAQWADQSTEQALADGGLLAGPPWDKYTPQPIVSRVGREMTAGEKVLAREMFGSEVNYKDVTIYNGKLYPGQGDRMAIAPNGDIYFAPKVYKEDFSLASDSSKHFFIHEMTHVWQYQNGQAVAVRALFEQAGHYAGIEAYDYKLDQRKDLLDYGIEQQASITADYWAKKNGLFKKLENSIRATNYEDANLSHYRIVVGK